MAYFLAFTVLSRHSSKMTLLACHNSSGNPLLAKVIMGFLISQMSSIEGGITPKVEIVNDGVCCMQGQQGRPSSAMSSWDGRAYSGAGVRAAGRRQNRRANALEPHIQQCCCKAASAVADDLQQRLAGLPGAQPAEASAQTIEEALLIGTAYRSCQLCLYMTYIV